MKKRRAEKRGSWFVPAAYAAAPTAGKSSPPVSAGVKGPKDNLIRKLIFSVGHRTVEYFPIESNVYETGRILSGRMKNAYFLIITL